MVQRQITTLAADPLCGQPIGQRLQRECFEQWFVE